MTCEDTVSVPEQCHTHVLSAPRSKKASALHRARVPPQTHISTCPTFSHSGPGEKMAPERARGPSSGHFCRTDPASRVNVLVVARCESENAFRLKTGGGLVRQPGNLNEPGGWKNR